VRYHPASFKLIEHLRPRLIFVGRFHLSGKRSQPVAFNKLA
jgi:hypothetical protein